MMKRAVFLFLLGVLCASTALAGTKRQVVSVLDGKTAGAGFGANISGLDIAFNMYPAPLPDGSKGYYVDINWFDGTSHDINGLVPASAVRAYGLWGPIQVNIAYVSFYSPDGTDYTDFQSLQGTFTVYKGPGSGTEGNNGTYFETETNLDGSVNSFSSRGTYQGSSATFEGTFTTADTYNLSIQGPNPTASIVVQTGTMREILYPPPTP